MSNQVNEIIAWLQLADDDYIAARTLLRQGFLVQGAIFSHSSIEKYLKLVHRIQNISFKTRGEKAHNLLKLYEKLKKNDSRKDLNESYLSLLVKVYKLRYPDRLNEEFNLALHQAKTLVGLDETVFKIRSRIQIKGADPDRPFEFEKLISENYEPLLQGNHSFGKAKRADLFKEPLLWYETRVLKNGNWMKATYVATAKDDGNYDLEGLRRGSSDREFILQNAPINSENN